MKRSLVFAAAAFLSVFAATAVFALPTWFGAGSTLVWGVNASGKNYDFNVKVKTLSPQVSFDWSMGAPANRKGSVTMSAQALATATAQSNYFTGGESLLTDKTTVWVSKAVFTALKENGKAAIDAGDGEEVLAVKDAKQKYSVLVDGKDATLTVLYAETPKGHKFWILDDAGAPLIVKMDLGWSIALKSVASK